MFISSKFLIVLAVVVVAAGCTRHVSRGLTDAGTVEQTVFPSEDKLTVKEGSFPNLDNLRQIAPGVTKEQVRDLLGSPHYREGFVAREWDYLFNFRDAQGKVSQCQFKVVFDGEYRGQQFAWAPAECAERLKPVMAEAPAKRFNLSADALFAFGKSGVADILPDGRAQLVSIANELGEAKPTSVEVSGHADRLGQVARNSALSQARADSVRQLLVQQGVDGSVVRARGLGESQPVAQCDDGLARAALIACLQPNRRVEIVATGVQ
jgi:outer membrane protein OmpA-like peptidoglycan-associated protein